MEHLDAGPCQLYLEGPETEVSQEEQEVLTAGQRVADRVAAVVGSWPFVLGQSLLILVWMGINLFLALSPGLLEAWDPYPFILLNLVLSFQAAYTGPIVLMSQNRLAEKDRITQKRDLAVDRLAEKEIEIVMQHLVYQDRAVRRLEQRLKAIEEKL
ncbi:MAG: DUF1003 domain-containing protein [Candidatus Eremiobacterota bacterium]